MLERGAGRSPFQHSVKLAALRLSLVGDGLVPILAMSEIKHVGGFRPALRVSHHFGRRQRTTNATNALISFVV